MSEPIITYWGNGNKRYEQYYKEGKLHREGGPAYIYWYSNGQKSYEAYYIEEELHREGGPAIIRWYENGQKSYEEYYIEGEQVDLEYFISRGYVAFKCKSCDSTFLVV